MKVLIQWHEEVEYESEITVDDDEIRAWLAESGYTGEITEGIVKDFLTSGDQSAWFDHVDLTRDCTGVPERTLDFIQQILPG